MTSLALPAPARRPLAAWVRRAWEHPVLGLALKLGTTWLLLVEVAVQGVFGRLPWLDIGLQSSAIPRTVLVSGAISGTLYGLMAMGLILVYRANRIINFAQAQLGAVTASLALVLIAARGMNYWLGVAMALVGGALLGGLSEVVVVRRFQQAPRLILTVVTIGLSSVLLVAEFVAKLWAAGDQNLAGVVAFPTPFDGATLQVGISTFVGDHLVAVLVSVGVLVGLGAFFRLSDIGIAVRAAAENAERAALLGIPVKRVITIVWILAGVLSAAGIFLRAPIVGLPLTGFVGPTFLLFGLAAAVVARMERLGVALVAGMFIGIIDTGAVFATRSSALAAASMLVVVLGALLLQRIDTSRASALEASSWAAAADPRPVPRRLATLRQVVVGRWAARALVVVALVAVPFVMGTNVALATQGVIMAIVGVSLVVLTGWAGQISLGQFGLAGIGAAVAGGLAANHNLDFFLTLAVAAAGGAAAAVLIGLPAVRIQGLFLAATTLTFAFTVERFVLDERYFGWLLPDRFARIRRPVLWDRIDLEAPSTLLGVTVSANAKFYFVCLAVLGAVMWSAASLRRHRSGRIFIGVRDNPRTLQAFGVSPAQVRIAAFAVAGAYAAIGGALLAYEQRAVNAGVFAPEFSIEVFVMVVIGGMAALSGSLLGAAFLVGVPLLPGLRDIPQIELLVGGVGLIVLLSLLPGGLADGVQRLRDRLLARIEPDASPSDADPEAAT